MEANKINILLSDEAKAFILSQPEKVRKKITFNIRKVECGEMDNELFKKLNDNIWELRTLYNGMCFRLLSFWDKKRRALVIATHGFVKKTWKVPKREIERAEAFMKLYYDNE